MNTSSLLKNVWTTNCISCHSRKKRRTRVTSINSLTWLLCLVFVINCWAEYKRPKINLKESLICKYCAVFLVTQTLIDLLSSHSSSSLPLSLELSSLLKRTGRRNWRMHCMHPPWHLMNLDCTIELYKKRLSPRSGSKNHTSTLDTSLSRWSHSELNSLLTLWRSKFYFSTLPRLSFWSLGHKSSNWRLQDLISWCSLNAQVLALVNC